MTMQIDIKELIPFMKDGWVAMNPNRIWYWYAKQPIQAKTTWMGVDKSSLGALNIKPVNDWTKSLIKLENKDE